MFPLSTDESFHFEILRALALARYNGADINEVLIAASKIIAGDFESFFNEFNTLANRTLSRASSIDTKKHPVSARDAYFAASSYFRSADFYLHGNKSDPRINELWKKQTEAFDKAIALLDVPGERMLLKGEGFDVPAIFYGVKGEGRKPTMIIGSGFDGAQEEAMHTNGFAALERGWNVITYEGPGQPSVVRDQGLGFIPEWEKVVIPVVDYLQTRKDVDIKKIGLIGISMGGYLAVRAAAFEHRLAAAIAIDGVYSVGDAVEKMAGPLANPEGGVDVDKLATEWLNNPKVPSKVRWGIGHGLWAFQTNSAKEYLDRTKLMTLEGVTDKIQCPVWVGLAQEDIFFGGQPEKVKGALGEKATLATLTQEDAAGEHCHVGAAAFMNQQVFDWFEDVVEKK
ncbi:related to hydrolases or acyltransferases (alpha/beta hydrolase superfamily) [Phialocephala subalpina]|uniref:Related to hydrolases or acyltransferases (Alpha/beta hydrolase superfamily) n=1 Tax=Phialocephala subalpina TaxID=576137 RepID=A0A1L7WC06_9HELO|nr:related to hydrolases or acyltransferases (alpha/beta hydrolase superfamily) [Phialocephala subalpina]